MKFPLVALLLLAGCSPSPKTAAPAPVVSKADYAPAIAAVLAKQHSAGTNAWIADPGWPAELNRPKIYSFAVLSKNLRAVDTTACPLPFRSAWLDYVHAVESYAAYKPSLTASELVNLAQGATAPLAIGEMMIRAKNPVDVRPSWQKLESVALEYGVDYPRF